MHAEYSDILSTKLLHDAALETVTFTNAILHQILITTQAIFIFKCIMLWWI